MRWTNNRYERTGVEQNHAMGSKRKKAAQPSLDDHRQSELFSRRWDAMTLEDAVPVRSQSLGIVRRTDYFELT
jgi:hypothetical protein